MAISNPGWPAWVIVGGSSSVQRVVDLTGTKVATIKATFPHRYLLEALKANGLAPSDIELVNMTIPDSEQPAAAEDPPGPLDDAPSAFSGWKASGPCHLSE